ncbi:MAG: uncharacterized protein QOE98_2630 [Gaiellaceae bacterium]|nr:uncharacterized protein [Gaiellaceae bacterium]
MLLVAAGLAVLPGVWATITIRQAFFDTLEMGSVYHRHVATERNLFLGTVLVLIVLGVPLLIAGLRVAAVPDRDGTRLPFVRRAVWSMWAVLAAFSALAFGTAMLAKGDAFLAATNAVPFGRTYAGHDISYFVFELPLQVSVLRLAAFALVLLAIASGAIYFAAEQRRRGSLVHAGDARRAADVVVAVTFAYGGLALVCLGLAYAIDRNSALIGGDDLISGADKATRIVQIPSQAVIGILIAVLGVATCALAVPRLRRTLFATTQRMAAVAAGTWIATAVLLAIFSTLWWIVLVAVSGLVGFALIRLTKPAPEGRPNLASAHGTLRRGKIDGWPDRAAWAAFVVLTAIVGGAAPAAGTSLYDHFTLSGPRYQNQRSYIERSIASTRFGFDLERMKVTDASAYVPSGVTQAAIAGAPASVDSLRFLSVDTAQPACERIQSRDQFYNCGDPHIDRYTIDSKRRTVFSIPRLIDWDRVTGFQRRHFAFTSGCGLVLSPVNEIDSAGRPRFIAGDIPQRGIDPPLEHPELYFGDDRSPWAMVDTSQNQFDCLKNQKTVWGGNGVKVGDHRLALSLFLGGLPLVGGGRQFWNSTDGNPAGGDAQALLYRGMRTRMQRLAPFLQWDSKPYYAAADGHVYVIDVGYATTDQLPYSEIYGGVRYLRSTVIGVMDAYSGETKLYVLDPKEPITATWMKVYPDLFTSFAKLPAGLKAHLKYGEDAFDVQAAALARYHVTAAETFFNGDQAWAFTEEATGTGTNGTRVASPSRYTYLVLPGQTTERFSVIRSYKPAAQGKGLGFSGWLAIDSEPDRFGEATILQFPQSAANGQQLDSLDTFTSNVARDPVLSGQIGVRRDQVRRGDTLVVPIGKGLLYVQPLYLDNPGDSLPTLWQVVVSFGDGHVFAGPTFAASLQAAFDGSGGDGGTGAGVPSTDTVQELVLLADTELAAWRAAVAAGNDAAAAQHFARMAAAIAQARALSDSSSPSPSTPGTTTTTPATTTTAADPATTATTTAP